MRATPRHPDTSTRLLGLIIVLVACSKAKPGPRDAPTPQPVAIADAAPQVRPAEPTGTPNRITVQVVEPTAAGSAFAKRCAIGGPPLATKDCSGGGSGIAIDRKGVVYVANGTSVHRYRASTDAACTLAPAGPPIAMPPPDPRPQKVGGGPMYFRSGGPAWHVTAAPDAVYAYDFLTGLYRIDRGKPEPACTDEFGYDSVAALGKRLLVGRRGVEQLALRGKGRCKASSAKIDDKVRGELHVIHGTLYVAERAGRGVTRYDGGEPQQLGAGDKTRICSIAALTACGDGVCALDNNCRQLIQYAADGTIARRIAGDRLFDQRPYGIQAATTAADGTVFVLARHRDQVGDTETCEAAVYALPAAVFER